jgi:hypothetical protein
VSAGVAVHRQLVAVVIGLSVAQMAFMLLWAAAASRALLMPAASGGFAIVCLLVSLRWCAGVLKHAVTYVSAGVYTSWLAANARANGHSRLLALRAAALEGDLPGEAEADEESSDGGAGVAAAAAAAASGAAAGGPGADDDVSMSDIGLQDFAAVAQPLAHTANRVVGVVGSLKHRQQAAPAGAAAALTGAAAQPVELDDGPSGGREEKVGAGTGGAPANEAGVAPEPPFRDEPGGSPDSAPARAPGWAVQHSDVAPLTFLRYALTWSFGSLAAGALLGFGAPLAWATLRGLRRVTRAATARNPRVATCGAAGVAAATAYIRVSSKYTWILVASKGRGWFPAARRTWAMLTSRGVEAVLEDDCTDRLLLFGCYVGGGVLSLLLGTTAHTGGTSSWLLAAAVTFWFGFIGVGLPLTVLEAAVSTLIVSFCQVPEVLSVLHPLVHARFLRLAELRSLERGHPAYDRVRRSYDDE